MRISQLDVEGIGAWPNFQANQLSAGLNLFYAGPKRGKSTAAGVVGHLLYGTPGRTWQPPFGDRAVLPQGSVVVDRRSGRFLLERKHGRDGASQLTVSTLEGETLDRPNMSMLLGDFTPSQAAQLLAVDFLAAPQPERLLQEPFLSHFGSKLQLQSADYEGESLDRKRIEQLVARRNAVARQLEERIGAGRHDEEVLEHEAKELDETLNQRRADYEALQNQLSKLDAELAEVNTYLRYLELQRSAVPRPSQSSNDFDQRLETIDQEIGRCRQSISDLQSRWSTLQAELVGLSPDGSADRVTYLADSRFTLGVVEKLLDDLDVEVAQLARGEETPRPVTNDAHARLQPIANLLRKQAYCLCGQLSEQERAARREQLHAEDRQLRRAQAELNDRLEQLLAQRESLIATTKAYERKRIHDPVLPASDLCRCSDHQRLVSSADFHARWSNEHEARQAFSDLERLRYELLNRLSTFGEEISDLESRWKQLQAERAGMLEGTSIDATRAELDRLELLLKQALNVRVYDPSVHSHQRWHASDLLAQLTDGQLVQVRLIREEEELLIINREGQHFSVADLTASQRDQLYLALNLALVSAYANRDISLPLVLDEPFLRQDAAATKIMAGVLEEFGRAGHQLLVFTENPHARRTLQSLSARIFEFGAEEVRVSPTKKTETITTTTTKLVRETRDGKQSPGLRLADSHVDGDIEAVFYLSKASSLSEFPLLGSETAKIFAPLSIHTVGQLLEADAESIARRLNRTGIDATTVTLWQSHMLLLCEVPGLTLNDAQLLTSCGIMSPYDLRHARTADLWEAISSFMQSDRSNRYSTSRTRYSRQRIDDWIHDAGGARERSSSRSSRRSSNRSSTRSSNRSSERSSSRSTRTGRSRTSRRSDNRTSRSNGFRSSSSGNERSERQYESVSTSNELKFHLEPQSDVEAAPSIGPKTAERLYKVGIHTVADLLSADPDSIAEKIGVRHIRPNTITLWQNQSRMVCQIPDLHGYGASLLVACGFENPEQVATIEPAQLISQIQEFCHTKQGQRILRSSQPPSAKRIGQWVELAQHRRQLEVA